MESARDSSLIESASAPLSTEDVATTATRGSDKIAEPNGESARAGGEPVTDADYKSCNRFAATSGPAKASFVPTRLAPAPVPASNPWKRGADPKPAANSVDALLSPQTSKKDEKREDKKEPPKRTTGKEKWVPYTPVVTTTPPPGTAGQNKSKQKGRGKQNGRKGNGNNTSTAASASSNATSSQQRANGRAEPNGKGPDSTPGTGPSSGSEDHLESSGQSQFHHGNNRKRKDHDKAGNYYGNVVRPVPAPYNLTLTMLVQQMEYYFSIENLCKDIFLRRQMNSKGLIPISVLASFNRVRAISGGDVALVGEACRWAPSAEVIGQKVRLAHDWERWVLPASDRLDAGREDDEDVPKFQIEGAVPFVPKTRSN